MVLQPQHRSQFRATGRRTPSADRLWPEPKA
jgi:hypothetical protein